MSEEENKMTFLFVLFCFVSQQRLTYACLFFLSYDVLGEEKKSQTGLFLIPQEISVLSRALFQKLLLSFLLPEMFTPFLGDLRNLSVLYHQAKLCLLTQPCFPIWFLESVWFSDFLFFLL